MTQLDILKQDLQRLIDKWKDKKDVKNNPSHPDYIKYRSDRLYAIWIQKQLAKNTEVSYEFAQKLFQ